MPITQTQLQSAQSRQYAASHDPRDQVRLVAGPGTGKSFAIEERVCWLLRNNIRPSSIFVVSFTRASARDLKNRIEKYCTGKGVGKASSVSVTTLHSLALRILRAAGLLAYPSDPMVMDTWEVKEIFDAEFSNNSGIKPKRCDEIRREHEAFWSTGQWGPPNYIPPNPAINPNERSIFQQFHTPRTQTYSCVLPGEIIRQCVRNISQGLLDPVSLVKIEHLIVDEFQDLNPCDLEFVNHLMQSGAITFVAGDDDQSIYSFRFAAPQGIQLFVSQYPSAGDHKITDCFRCTPSIVGASGSIIGTYPVPNRILKTLNSLYVNANPPLQGMVDRWCFPSGVAEAKAIAESCRDLINAGMPPREILILLANTLVMERDLMPALDSLMVPHERPRALSYIESHEGRLAFTILRIVCNKKDYVAHRSLLGLMPGVGIRTCDIIARKVVTNNLNFSNLFYHPLPRGVFSTRESSGLNKARSIAGVLAAWQKLDLLSQRDTEIRNILGNYQGATSSQAWTNATCHLPQDITLEELRDYLWADTDEQETAILEAVYQRLCLSVPLQGVLPQRIRIMTMHGAKGLSARVVFVPGLEEDIFPGHWRTPYPGLVLEAARLLYVSISRARAACILSFAKTRIVYGRAKKHAPSRFAGASGGAFAYRHGGGLSVSQVNSIMWECSQL